MTKAKPDYLGFAVFWVCILTLGAVLMGSCSCARIDNNTRYSVEGDATIHIVVGVDVTICQELEAEAKADCIKALLEIAKKASEAQGDQPEGFGGI